MSATATIIKYAPVVYKYAKNDLNKRYDLLEDWELPPLNQELPDFDNEYFLIRGNRIRVKKYRNTHEVVICDGCTLVPDDAVIKTIIAALFHDPWYMSIKAIAAAWGWTESDVRKLGDVIFGNILVLLAREIQNWFKRQAALAVAYAYYWGVRAFGGIARTLYAYVGALVIALLLAGCTSSCMPTIFQPGSTLIRPAYTNATPASVVQP